MKTKVFFPGNDIIDFSLAIFTWYFGVVRDLRVSQMYNSGLIMVYFKIKLLINAYQGAALFNIQEAPRDSLNLDLLIHTQLPMLR